MKRGYTALFSVCFWLLAVTTSAQSEGAKDEDTARTYFLRGQEAFDSARYEEALDWFWRAYGETNMGELQYDIGLTADRLQREEEALEAFRRYLAETKDPDRRVEVEGRIEALKRSLAVREASTLALEQAELRYEELAKSSAAEQAAAERKRRIALVGGSVLVAAGTVGLGAMTWGVLKEGSCDERAGDAQACVGEQSATTWTWVYGGLGAAALVGGLTWLVVGGKRSDTKETRVGLSPTGVFVRGRF